MSVLFEWLFRIKIKASDSPVYGLCLLLQLGPIEKQLQYPTQPMDTNVIVSGGKKKSLFVIPDNRFNVTENGPVAKNCMQWLHPMLGHQVYSAF